jgi:pullulanase
MKNKKILVLISIASIATLAVTSCGETETTSTATDTTTSVDEISSEVSTAGDESTSDSEITEESIVFHYHRDDGDYDDWGLWLWETDGDGSFYSFDYEDDFGVYGEYALSNWSDTSGLNYILRYGEWSWQTADLTLSYADFPADENLEHHCYIAEGKETQLFDNTEDALASSLSSCYFTSFTEIGYASSSTVTEITVSDGSEIIYSGEPNKTSGKIDLGDEFELDLTKSYEVVAYFGDVHSSYTAPFTYLYGLEDFDDQYEYTEQLGAIYSDAETTFRLWAPTSSEVTLNIYDTGTPVSISATEGSDIATTYEMLLKDKGVYETTVTGNLDGKYYTYTVTNSLGTNETIDPYARTCGVNGIRGEIVDLDSTDPTGWDDVVATIHPSTELAVYEMHVADVTSDDTWTGTEANRTKYLGLSESGTTYTQGADTVATGFDHIKETNVNAVQIQPFFDQDNDETDPEFNWGYNPQNYNCLEGSYSSNPYDGKVRMNEFKQVVKEYSEAGIEVIMDVVYNHVSSLSNSAFNKTVPGYYFRYKSDMLTASNGSGCGNETASDHSMMENFMLDSTEFLASEYKLGGYRFDLMGLHGCDTMNLIEENLTENVNENITVYGEPWTGGTTTLINGATKSNITQVPEIGMFNDEFRNKVSGDNNGASSGWVNNNIGGTAIARIDVNSSLKGGYSSNGDNINVKQNIAYVGCHDNATIYDKFYNVDMLNGTEYTDDQLADMSVQASALVFTSQGISFMQGGDELMRQKLNEDGSINTNSYNTTYEMNSIKYDRKIEYADQYQEYCDLIDLKTSRAELQLDDKTACTAALTFNSNSSNSCFDYEITSEGSSVYAITNNIYDEETIDVPSGDYAVVVDTKNVISTPTYSGGSLVVPAGATIILTID